MYNHGIQMNKKTSVGVFLIVLCLVGCVFASLQLSIVGRCNSEKRKIGCYPFYIMNCLMSLFCILKVFGIYHLF